MQELIDRLRGALAEARPRARGAEPSRRRWRTSACSTRRSRSGRSRIRSWPRPRCSCSMPDAATLLVASFHAGARCAQSRCPSSSTARTTTSARPLRRWSWRRRCAASTGGARARSASRLSSLPVAVARRPARPRAPSCVEIDELVVAARRVKLPVELAAIRRASQLSDVVQSAVKELAQPGRQRGRGRGARAGRHGARRSGGACRRS